MLRREEGWLTFEAEVEPLTPPDTWWRRLVEGRPSAGHLATSPDASGTVYRSELCLGEEPESELSVRVRDFQARALRPQSSTEVPHRMSGDVFRGVCREAGIKCADNDGIPEWVYLPGPSRQDRAWIRTTSTGFRIVVDVVRVDSVASFEQREATAVLVLTVAGMVRLLGAAIEIDGNSVDTADERFRVQLESELPPVPESFELSHALGALSTGLRLARAESEVLADERTAWAYLTVRNSQSCGQDGYTEQRGMNDDDCTS